MKFKKEIKVNLISVIKVIIKFIKIKKKIKRKIRGIKKSRLAKKVANNVKNK